MGSKVSGPKSGFVGSKSRSAAISSGCRNRMLKSEHLFNGLLVYELDWQHLSADKYTLSDSDIDGNIC